jgi:Mg/Co/Ni transporter MgtE
MDDAPIETDSNDDSFVEEIDDRGVRRPIRSQPIESFDRDQMYAAQVEYEKRMVEDAWRLAEMSRDDAGRMLAGVGPELGARMLAQIKDFRDRTQVFSYMHPRLRPGVLDCMDPPDRANVFLWMSPRERAAVLEDQSALKNARMLKETLEHMDPEQLNREEMLTPANNPRGLAQTFALIEPRGLAQTFAKIDPEVRPQVFVSMYPPTRATVFAYMLSDERQDILNSMGPRRSVQMLASMDKEWRDRMLAQMDPRVASQMHNSVNAELERSARERNGLELDPLIACVRRATPPGARAVA